MEDISAKAFQLRAWIQGWEGLILVDFGGSTSLINQHLANCIDDVQSLPRECRVRIANNGELICSFVVPQCVWCSQGHEFTTEMKMLALGTYGAILGMDWLETHNPMTVD